jgi:His/Glu/Gln/Arg/opine family amino acid ABC transporter permease subunit
MGPESHDTLSLLITAWPALQKGVVLTLQLAAVVVAITLTLGVSTAVTMVYGGRWTRAVLRIYVDFIRGVPALAIIFSIYYLLPLIGLQLRELTAAAVALSVFFTAHVTEVARGALESVARGQEDAAKAAGLRFMQRLAYVVFPQAMRRFLPPWMNVVVEIIKGTALVSLLGIVDLMLATQQVVGRTFEAMLFYGVAVAIYVAINATLSNLSRLLERQFAYLDR